MVRPRLHLVACSSVLALLASPAGAALRSDELRASAGPDRTLLPPATTLTLQGSVHGLKHTETSSLPTIQWLQLGGPPATLLDADTLQPTVVPGRAGSLRLRLRVTDPQGRVDVDDVFVHAFGADQDAVITGERRKWHKLALTFEHDAVLGESSALNPFLDLRMVVHFFNPASGAFRSIPGFFAADGDAAQTSATAGTRWRVNFVPDAAGDWYYYASFRTGDDVALSFAPEAGQAVSFDGENGTFFVEPTLPDAPGFLAKGQLEYVGKHHLRFAETHEHFLKVGTNSPENFLAYYEFDNTFDQGGPVNDLNTSGARDGLHHYDAHLGDYVDLGVPTWKNGRGKRIFGALSYLAAQGVNSVYTLTYNLDGGDGREISPWVTGADKLRFDVSKLAQWERVADHMTRAGIVWHVITQEYENDHEMDGGALGPVRKLYYRELVARFGHTLGLVWNLGEENTNSPEERMAFAEYIRAIDPYDHPISLHNVVGDIPNTFGTLLGTHLELLSVQGDPANTPPRVRGLVDDSAEAGRPWVVNFDEQSPADSGVVPDAFDFWHDTIRRDSLWPMLLGQGGGVEWYFGYAYPNSDLDCEDFSSRENMWHLSARAAEFLRTHVPFEDMQHADDLATGTRPNVLALPGEHYVVYLPSGGPVTLDLETHAGTFLVSWFDPRNGGPLQGGTVAQVTGPGAHALGTPPGNGDWVAWVRLQENAAPLINGLSLSPRELEPGRDVAVRVHARDPNGPTDALDVHLALVDPAGVASVVRLTHRGGSLYSLLAADVPQITPGTWQVVALAEDGGGLSAAHFASFVAP
jgi:hypothetical protein